MLHALAVAALDDATAKGAAAPTPLLHLENLAWVLNSLGAELVCWEDSSDLSTGRPDFVSRHPKLHLPPVLVCAQKLGRSRGDHLYLVWVNAEAEVV